MLVKFASVSLVFRSNVKECRRRTHVEVLHILTSIFTSFVSRNLTQNFVLCDCYPRFTQHLWKNSIQQSWIHLILATFYGTIYVNSSGKFKECYLDVGVKVSFLWFHNFFHWENHNVNFAQMGFPYFWWMFWKIHFYAGYEVYQSWHGNVDMTALCTISSHASKCLIITECT